MISQYVKMINCEWTFFTFYFLYGLITFCPSHMR